MKILIINGSPKKKGLISQMLDIMRVEAENRGDIVDVICRFQDSSNNRAWRNRMAS